MQKEGVKKSRVKSVLLTILAFLFVLLVILPLAFMLLGDSQFGNVALIPIEGIITGDGSGYLGKDTISSQDLVDFIEEADENTQIEVILLEINSPGGSAVASDEIASAVKRAHKPVVAVIREMGASGGYWIASTADHIIANRMSITGSIGVISSYLEFSGLMEKYGVDYERLVAGEYKDVGMPFRKLEPDERALLQAKLNRIHTFFIQEVAANRNLSEETVREIATGEFYLGVEALPLGLVDQLGNRATAEEYITETYGLDSIDYVVYQRQGGLFDMLAGVFADFSFKLGQGIGSISLQREGGIMLI